MILGELRIEDFLNRTQGAVRGRQFSDGKDRYYMASYEWSQDGSGLLSVQKEGTANPVKLPPTIELDESLVAFWGLYCGDGAKGSEDPQHPGRLRPNISFSQREPNLIRFALEHLTQIFPEAGFTFSLGEDSAFFMAGEGLDELKHHHGGTLPPTLPLDQIRPRLREADERYLRETRRRQLDPERDLAFYYQHKSAMQDILERKKAEYLASVGIYTTPRDRVTASLRRPYKKGARQRGGSSRSDEMHVRGVSGVGELFLKMLHEVENSILLDLPESPQGLVRWHGKPSQIGEVIDVRAFFEHHCYGRLAGERPTFRQGEEGLLHGRWPRSRYVDLKRTVRIDPLWCYTSGLYLAEGTTSKYDFFSMYRERPAGMGLGFTSSENTSLALLLRALQHLLPKGDCVDAWKVKVGSQYFPELVVVGLKNGVPMLRGGRSGDGKLRTMEISLEIKEWALSVAPAMEAYRDRFSHVEPTGAGVPRIDFWASSSLCKWYFPLVMYATFVNDVDEPAARFAP